MSAIRACLAAMLLLAGCATSRFYDNRYVPAPLETEITTQGVAGSQVRALVTVIGIERPREGVEARAVLRMRLENLGTVTAKLDTATLSLVSADLKAFGPAAAAPVEGTTKEEIAAGGVGVFDVLFPLPAGIPVGALDLSTLNLRFTVVFDGQRVTNGATFQRVDWAYGDPRVNVGVGFGWAHVD